ncbi:MAG: SoxR reducing system RseC family protein [Deltaproteobacteria bacterium]|nr:SoxR reducing system RseC family protein [Deltaproteobacteria bacterium]MBW2152268.1 SoxR reducing system RseC family protein [Deltaproteobacteria bacterium]
MIEDTGTVLEIDGDRASVIVERSSNCLMCGFQEAERLAPGGKPVFETLNTAGASIGDRVKIQVAAVACVKALIWVFGIPILLLIAGTLLGGHISRSLGKSSDALSALLGTGGLIIGMSVLFLFRKKLNKKKYMPVIVEVIKRNAAS